MNKLVNAILDKAVETKSGIWFPNVGINGADKDVVNFSLSHGITGILLTLIKSNKVVVNRNKYKRIISKTVDYIKSYKFIEPDSYINLEG